MHFHVSKKKSFLIRVAPREEAIRKLFIYLMCESTLRKGKKKEAAQAPLKWEQMGKKWAKMKKMEKNSLTKNKNKAYFEIFEIFEVLYFGLPSLKKCFSV